MDQLNKEQIKNLSKLCRIQLSEEELATFPQDISKVLHYIAQLSEVDFSSLTPRSHIEAQGVDTLREDKVEDLLPRELFLKNAQKQIGGMISVPPILKST